MKEKDLYKRLYYVMFNGATDALKELENQNFGAAKDILRNAQLRAEEIYMEEGDGPNGF